MEGPPEGLLLVATRLALLRFWVLESKLLSLFSPTVVQKGFLLVEETRDFLVDFSFLVNAGEFLVNPRSLNSPPEERPFFSFEGEVLLL